MSKSGQYNFTGISAQADITLFYLLQSRKRSDFQRLIIEGNKWEDFTLVFDDHNEDFEVKWHSKPVSYRDIKAIIDKELMKQYGEKDVLKIVVKNMSREFKEDYEYIRHSLYWWYSFNEKDYKKNHVIKKFIQKNWAENAIAFLLKTEIIELKNDKNVNERILEYFALEDPFYLSPQDRESVVSQSFRKIFKEGSKGGSISRQQFITSLVEFKSTIAEKSESFSPEISIGNKILSINSFLQSEQDFKKLDHAKYLSPITANSRLIFYITDKLGKSQLNVSSFEFFIKKILMKQFYVRLTMRLLEKKWEQGKVDSEYLLDFMITNYKNLFYDFNYDDALKVIKEIAKKDTVGKYENKILEFLKREILKQFGADRQRRFENQRRGWHEEEQVANLLEVFYKRTANKKRFIDFIFEYFDFTSDDFSNVIETHPKTYTFVKDYIAENLKDNFDYVVKKISKQFNTIYNGKYKGYEWSGSGIGQSGSSYSITDKGVVRLLFKPLFSDLYAQNPEEAWEFFKKEVLNKATKGATKDSPIFLKRALISIILDRISDERLSKPQKKEALNYLKNILKMKKGIPGTSEIIFDELRRRDLSKIGFKNIMILIGIDSIKYKRKGYSGGYPTNLFIISTLFGLIKANYEPAKNYFLSLIKKPDFPKRDQRYDSFELMSADAIPETDPDFIVEVFKTLDIENYLNSLQRNMVWDKSGILTGLIKRDWQDKTNKGKQIIDKLLKGKSPSKVVLEFISGPIRKLAEQDALKTYELFEFYLKNKAIFKKTFKNNPYTRQNIVWLAEELAKNKYYNEAKKIIELCIDDPDPETHNRQEDFNYHLQVKKGEDQIIITTVRGTLAWVIQKLAVSNNPRLMKYALEKIEVLLDVDGFLAKQLGYSEPDYYVRLQALIPLIELAHPARRKLLNDLESGLGDKLKTISFKIIDVIEDDIIKSNINPKAILKYLVHVFSNIRDLSTNEAKQVLEFFEKKEVDDAYFLYIYFAEYREKQYKDIPFNSAYFKEKLRTLCKTTNIFRPKIAWEFWRMADKETRDNKNQFGKIEGYWKLLFNDYQKEVFNNLYRTLEITLTWPEKYDSHKELLKKAIQKETQYIKNTRQLTQLWGLESEIFQLLKGRDVADFFEIFYFLIENIDENIHYFGMNDWIEIFKSMHSIPKKQIDIYNKIQSRLLELYPENFETVDSKGF